MHVLPKGERLPVEVQHYIPCLVCESVDCAAGQLVAGQSGGENIVPLGSPRRPLVLMVLKLAYHL